MLYSSNKSDAQLTREIKNSNSAAFQSLFYRYYETLYYFIYNRILSQELAKDFIQDIFTRLWQTRSNLNPDLSIKAYLFRSARNILIDHYRKMKSRQAHLEEHIYSQENETFPENDDLERSIHQAISELPDNIRTVFIMNRIDGLKYREIAETLEISVKTVEARMSKALRILREALRQLLMILIFLCFTASNI